MTTHDALLPAVVLQRKAVVYVRQSTPQQVQLNLESQRRQYELVEVARRRGFTNIEVIDDDLGRTASGAVERPGFDRLVAALCAGQVGAVLCLDASRLARNGRDWHHLLELCGLVEERVIDLVWGLRSVPPKRPPAARNEGQHQRVRAWDHPSQDVRRGPIKGEARRAEDLGTYRLLLGSTCRPEPRSGSAAAGGDYARVPEVHGARQCPPSAVVDGVPEYPFSLPVGRQNIDVVRLAADQISQCHLDSQEPLLCGRLRLWQEREAHRDRRWPCTQKLRPPQADGHLGGVHQRSSRGLHQLGRV